jgi:hypothetical protein
MDVIGDIASQIVVTIAVGGVAVLLYFSADIYMIVKKKDFGKVNVSIMYFTRNDYNSKGDALHLRVIDYRIPLKEIYKNRFLLWRVLFVSTRVSQSKPVLNFKEATRLYLSPARGIIARITAEGEFKRACGLPFVEEKFQIAMVRDISDETGRDVLKIVVMREKDLQGYQSYLNNPPNAGKNFHLFKYLGRAYEEIPEAFLPVQIVMA